MELEIFRAGQYGPKGEWNEQALEGLARDYDAAIHEAPVTLDHAQSGPALGWVDSVQRVGDRLVAKLHDLNPAFTDLVKQGAFKKRSVELYPAATHSGRPYLKAVSFLGAAVPAVKGLRDVLLSDATGAIHFEQTLQDDVHIDFAENEETQPTPPRESAEPKGTKTPGEGNGNEKEASKAACDFAETSEAENNVAQEGEVKNGAECELDFTRFREALTERGAWLPSWEQLGIEKFAHELSRTERVDFQAGQSAGLLNWFQDFLISLPRFLPLGESAAAGIAPTVSKRFEEGLINDVNNIDPASLERHRRASLLMDTQPGLCYAEPLQLSSKS